MKIVVQEKEKEQKLTGATRTFEEEAVPLDSPTTYAKQLSLLYRFSSFRAEQTRRDEREREREREKFRFLRETFPSCLPSLDYS